MKNRNRVAPTFANINLLGKCNVNCYFCLGKDIPKYLNQHDQTQIHFKNWKNFEIFLKQTQSENIKKVYITGQNTDSLVYKHLQELIEYCQNMGFTVGIRTNGYLALKKMDAINTCLGKVGYSAHSLIPDKNYAIMGHRNIPDWNKIIPRSGDNVRISSVVTRYNADEIEDIIKYFAKYPNVKYFQVRRVSTDTRQNELQIDIDQYQNVVDKISMWPEISSFFAARRFRVHGLETVMWPTVETTANSWNYFTDGTISPVYFVVEGYLKYHNQTRGQN